MSLECRPARALAVAWGPGRCRWSWSGPWPRARDEDAGGGDADLVIYTGRAEEQVGDLIAQFEEESGTTVDVRYGDTAELAVQLLEEGDASPADLFWAQDAGALSAVDEAGPARRPAARRCSKRCPRSTAPRTVAGSAHRAGPASSPTTPTR